MTSGRIPVLSLLLVACAFTPGPSVTRAAELPNDRVSIEHALNRLTFGPRPGDIERVQRLGFSTWLDQQLNPSQLDDRGLLQRLPAQPQRPTQFASPREARRFGRQSTEALASAKMLRAMLSEHQLEEVLVDFWFNHFNVFAGKGRTGAYLESYEADVIRAHALGRFRDLLGATAKSPAMLFYLDNWLSADPGAAERLLARRQSRRRRQSSSSTDAAAGLGRRRGINENYARELMELHTLGVDGGYTQADIAAVARAFTGWTIGRTGFRFARELHDGGMKVVLGQTIPRGGGMEDGERVLDILASHPSTARHIATKLAKRFVRDDPPETVITRVARRFTETDGNLREVVRVLVTSPEFFEHSARRAKVKTPLEFVASALRATGREVGDATRAVNALRELGMPLYMCQPPTGYDDTAETWTSAGALIARMNVAQQIAGRDVATIGGPEFQRR